MRKLVLALLLVLLPSLASAATYYVRTDGNNACNGLYNTGGSSGNCAWRTIDYAADNIPAGGGHTVRVQAGTYAEGVSPLRNGTSHSNTNTFVADGTVNVCRWTFSGSSYIRVIGFNIAPNHTGCTMANEAVLILATNTGLEFWHNKMHDASRNGIYGQESSTNYFNNGILVGNEMYNLGIGNGGGEGFILYGSQNVYAHNEIYNVHPDGACTMGVNKRFLNTYVHNLSQASGGHIDMFQSGSSSSARHTICSSREPSHRYRDIRG